MNVKLAEGRGLPKFYVPPVVFKSFVVKHPINKPIPIAEGLPQGLIKLPVVEVKEEIKEEIKEIEPLQDEFSPNKEHKSNIAIFGEFKEDFSSIAAKPNKNVEADAMVNKINAIGPIANVVSPSLPFTPASLRSVYNYTLYPPLQPNVKRSTIAIVDAYLYRTYDGTATFSKSNAYADLVTFCNVYSLPVPSGPTYITGTTSASLPPKGNKPWFAEFAQSGCGLDPGDTSRAQGWPLEQALDLQWAWAMTCNIQNNVINGPNIILLHSKSANDADLGAMIEQAKKFGADVISLSWGGGELAGETKTKSGSVTDYTFINNSTGVTYVASSGDAPSPSYPALSPYVLAAGGTTLTLTNNNNVVNRLSEVYWKWNNSVAGGGGLSKYEAEPDYQKLLPSQALFSTKKRGIPDLSFVGDPNTGVLVVYSNYIVRGTKNPKYTPSSFQLGGTSLSAPCLAGLVSIVNQNRLNANKVVMNTTTVLTALYNLTANTNPYCNGNILDMPYSVSLGGGYDLTTGLGVPYTGLINYLSSL
jgi:subtilase family serine protease